MVGFGVDVAERAQPLQPPPDQRRAKIRDDQRDELAQLVPVLACAADRVGEQPPARTAEPGGRRRPLCLGHAVAAGRGCCRLPHHDL